MNTLGLYVKRDGQAEYGCIATAKFEKDEATAQESLNKIKSGWIHNGPPEYVSASYRIAPYNLYGVFPHD